MFKHIARISFLIIIVLQIYYNMIKNYITYLNNEQTIVLPVDIRILYFVPSAADSISISSKRIVKEMNVANSHLCILPNKY